MSGPIEHRWSPATQRLVEAVMSAAETIGTPEVLGGLVPAGSPVVAGRVHLGRLRSRLPAADGVVVLVGFGSLAWLGTPDSTPPPLGRLVYRAEASVDRRGSPTPNCSKCSSCYW
jgi:hypothetical protein